MLMIYTPLGFDTVDYRYCIVSGAGSLRSLLQTPQ